MEMEIGAALCAIGAGRTLTFFNSVVDPSSILCFDGLVRVSRDCEAR